MSESLLGRSVAATRQNAGRDFGEIGDGMNPPPGIVNAPAATVCAEVMVVSGSARDARLSQVAALARAPRETNRAVRIHRLGIVESIICLREIPRREGPSRNTIRY